MSTPHADRPTNARSATMQRGGSAGGRTEVATTRLAPSPTGGLHLGNLRTFLLTWLLARAGGWRLILRMEDLDRERVKPGAVEEVLALLEWLGLDHDGPVLRQSADLEPYLEAMRRLAASGLIYACTLSRRELRLALSAPHAADGEQCVPATMRPTAPDRWGFLDPAINHRFATPPGEVVIEDRIAGRRRFEPTAEVGDFVLWTRQGVPSYQLAVVVDDHRQGVTDVVRGDDLLSSAARQALIHRALGQPEPRWWHVPLVLDAAGERLAKRHDSTSAAAYRAAGVAPERVLGLLGWWLGLLEVRAPCPLRELLARVADRGHTADPAGVRAASRGPTLPWTGLTTVRFTLEDHQWLLET